MWSLSGLFRKILLFKLTTTLVTFGKFGHLLIEHLVTLFRTEGFYNLCYDAKRYQSYILFLTTSTFRSVVDVIKLFLEEI